MSRRVENFESFTGRDSGNNFDSSSTRMNVGGAFTPITWKYGAVAAGAALTQGLGAVWYSPQVFGPIWQRNHPITAATMTEKDHTTSMAVSFVSDCAFGMLMNYLQSRYFRPLTPTDALIFTAIIGGIQMLPQIGHVLWGKKKPDEFFVDHGYNMMGILIKVLCLMYIPY